VNERAKSGVTGSQTPLVSAIIATYNRAHIVGEAIESILQQTYPNVELIVVDDGSTDRTQEKLEGYGARIRVVYQKNAGPAAAWNAGIRASRGDIIAFLGSDDIWLPRFVERQVSVLQQCDDSVPCCLANCSLKFGNGKESTSFDNALLSAGFDCGVWLNVPEVLSTRFVVFGQAVAVRRTALDRVGGFDESLRYLEDYDMALRLSLLGPWAFISGPLVEWRQGNEKSDSLSQEARREPIQLKQNIVRIHEHVLNQLSGDLGHERFRRRMLRKLRRDRLNLIIERLKQTNAPGSKLAGKFLGFVDHYSYSVLRHSPWFHKMKAKRFDGEPAFAPSNDVNVATLEAVPMIKRQR
jgi:glycosyltransferase involved in cell wall biosynthesis